MEPVPNELQVYCDCMERVKSHVKVAVDALSGKVLLPGYQSESTLLAEVVFLRLRKALEEIAFASLAANREKYAKARPGFATEWNARRMLGFIEKANPRFYPLPLAEPTETRPGVKHFERMAEPFLTRNDFELLYDSAGQILHSPNPFSPHEVVDVRYTAQDWITRIGRLLSWHLMEIPDVSGVWLIRVPADAASRAFFVAADGPFVVER